MDKNSEKRGFRRILFSAICFALVTHHPPKMASEVNSNSRPTPKPSRLSYSTPPKARACDAAPSWTPATPPPPSGRGKEPRRTKRHCAEGSGRRHLSSKPPVVVVPLDVCSVLLGGGRRSGLLVGCHPLVLLVRGRPSILQSKDRTRRGLLFENEGLWGLERRGVFYL